MKRIDSDGALEFVFLLVVLCAAIGATLLGCSANSAIVPYIDSVLIQQFLQVLFTILTFVGIAGIVICTLLIGEFIYNEIIKHR